MRRVVIGLLVLVGLLVAVDYGSAALAESAVSRQMREQIGLADDPSVRINGFPFLTQAVSGHYRSVDIDAPRIHVGQLQELDVSAQLRDVSAPLSMLLGSGPKTLGVQEAEGTVRVSASDVQRLIPGIKGLRIDSLDKKALQQAVKDGGQASLAQLDPEKVARFVGTGTVLGQQVQVSVIALLQLTDGQAEIVPQDIQLGDKAPALPAAVLRIDPGSLPLKVTPTALRANNGVLEISGVAQNLTLGATTPTS
jgi:hypothetical protein